MHQAFAIVSGEIGLRMARVNSQGFRSKPITEAHLVLVGVIGAGFSDEGPEGSGTRCGGHG